MPELTTDRSGRTLKEYRQLYWDGKERIKELEAKLDAVQKHYDKWMLGELNDLDCVNRIGDVLEAIGEQE